MRACSSGAAASGHRKLAAPDAQAAAAADPASWPGQPTEPGLSPSSQRLSAGALSSGPDRQLSLLSICACERPAALEVALLAFTHEMLAHVLQGLMELQGLMSLIKQL